MKKSFDEGYKKEKIIRIRRPELNELNKIKFSIDNNEIIYKKIGPKITDIEIKEKFKNFEELKLFLKEKVEIETNEKIKLINTIGDEIDNFEKLLIETTVIIIKNKEE